MKQHTTYKILFFLLIIALIWSCERDDICAESTVTTPHLIIRFYDASNTDNKKVARQLTVSNEDGLEYSFEASTDSIVLPLRFQEENVLTTTRFILKKDTDYDDDGLDTTESNSDIIEITYNPQFVYVSRACGYKSVFSNTNLNIESDTNNWIINKAILNSTIDNENAAQVILYH